MALDNWNQFKAFCEQGNLLSSKELLQGLDVAEQFRQNPNDIAELVIVARIAGYSQIVDLIFQHPDFNPNGKLSNGMTLLQWAVVRDDIDLVKALLAEQELDVNQVGKNNETALVTAMNELTCVRGKATRKDIIVALVQHDKIKIRDDKIKGKSLFQWACNVHRFDVVDEFLKHKDVELNEVDHKGSTALIIGLNARREVVVLRLLQEPALDVNKPAMDGKLPFDSLLRYMDVNVKWKLAMEMLLSHPNLDVCQAFVHLVQGNDDLSFHKENSHKKIAKLFLDYISKIKNVDNLLKLADGIGIGNGNKTGNHQLLSMLRYRDLSKVNKVGLFKNMGYRETDDSAIIGLAILKSAKLILENQENRVATVEGYNKFFSLFHQKICRSGKNPEVRDLEKWFDDTVERPRIFAVQA